jgi:hypothetical protein
MWRTLVLWVVLVAMFIAIYQSLGGGTHGAALGGFGPWLAVAPLMVGLLLWSRRQRGINQLSVEGAELLHRGRAAEALAKFEEFRGKSRSAVGPFNVGIARMTLWQLDEAARELEVAKKGSKQLPAVRHGIPVLLGLIHALRGDTRAANDAIGAVDAKLKDTGQVLLAQAALSCRAGDFAKGRELLGRHEVKQLGGFNGALAAALHAWSVEQTQNELRHVDRIALFGETGPERLKAAWPELAAFVERAPAA